MSDTPSQMTPEDAALVHLVEVELLKVAKDFGECANAHGPFSEALAGSRDQLHERLHNALLFVARRLVARPRPLILEEAVLISDVVVVDGRVLFSPTFSLPENIQESLDAMRKVTLQRALLFATLSVVSGLRISTGERIVVVSCTSGDQPIWRRYAVAPARPDRTCEVTEWTVVEPTTDMSIVETPPHVTPFGVRSVGSDLVN